MSKALEAWKENKRKSQPQPQPSEQSSSRFPPTLSSPSTLSRPPSFLSDNGPYPYSGSEYNEDLLSSRSLNIEMVPVNRPVPVVIESSIPVPAPLPRTTSPPVPPLLLLRSASPPALPLPRTTSPPVLPLPIARTTSPPALPLPRTTSPPALPLQRSASPALPFTLNPTTSNSNSSPPNSVQRSTSNPASFTRRLSDLVEKVLTDMQRNVASEVVELNEQRPNAHWARQGSDDNMSS
eukprot:c14710_g1_i1.p1 GENE.c14710_g1_i1~~c14710_g1_i1.p1  ORF type:complete len:260 (-),score=36.84 c14710_g1_i1:80-790(-)